MGGSGPHEGNVHVDGMPVCHDGWNLKDAWVVCKQLGYQSVVKFTNFFGPVANIFSMNFVDCTGFENSLFDCPHENNYHSYCDPWDGAGVICSSEVRSIIEQTVLHGQLIYLI